MQSYRAFAVGVGDTQNFWLDMISSTFVIVLVSIDTNTEYWAS